MRSDYLERYLRALGADPTADVFSGAIRWGSDTAGDYPGYTLATNVYTVMNMLTQRRGGQNNGAISTIGPNSGFRLSAYAAAGGCDDLDDLGVGADSVLGRKVIAARGGLPGQSRADTPGYGYVPDTNGDRSRRRRRRSRRDREAYIPPTVPVTTTRKVIQHVVGAQIDSNPDRLLGAYRQGKWIVSGWNGFDENTYQDRTVQANLGTLGPEDPNRDIDSIAERLERNIQDFATYMYPQPGVVSSALGLYFGVRDPKGNPLYETSWDDQGKFHFRFTDEGKVNLRKQLTRDAWGRFDPYGNRIRRRLYNEVNGRSTRRPASNTPRLVRPINGTA
jgi:hypothetical protein